MQASFFFEPGQLGAQSSNLGVQFVQLFLVFGFPGFFALVFILEQLLEVLQRLLLPVMDLVRVQIVLSGNLCDGAVLLQGFEDDLRLLACSEVSSFRHGVSGKYTLIMPVFVSKFPYPLKSCQSGNNPSKGVCYQKENKMSETKRKLSAWTISVVFLSLLLFFFAIPHTLEDFAVGEPAKNGVSAPVLAFVVAGLFALQGLALFWAGRQDRRSY